MNVRSALGSIRRILRATLRGEALRPKRHFLGAYAVMCDEGHIISEWIETHLREGVEHFYLVDHGSRDGWREAIASHLRDGRVTVINATQRTADEARAENCALAMRECEWVIIMDLDEFTHCRSRETIRDVLKRLPWRVAQVKVPWLLFGTAGNVTQPRSVVRGCLKREDLLATLGRPWHAKSIVRGSRLLHLRVHSHLVLGTTVLQLDRTVRTDSGPFVPDSYRECLRDFALLQNHYNLQSRAQFESKARKRDPNTGKPASKYTEEYFMRTESFTNSVRDEFLYNRYNDVYDAISDSSAAPTSFE